MYNQLHYKRYKSMYDDDDDEHGCVFVMEVATRW
jgi:hypothetical protein